MAILLDIQAVVAADLIRNLREETGKGIVGRLRPGFFPLPAPIVHLDNGRGRAKRPTLAEHHSFA